MDSKQIRKIRLMQLITREKAQGRPQVWVAEKIDTNPAYLSQILGEGGRRVGDKLARKIEKAFKLRHGWMDSLGGDSAEVTPEVMEMALLIDDLPEAQKAAIRATLEAFRKPK